MLGLAMHDDLRRFSIDAFPESLRQAAWDEALSRLLLRSRPAGAALAGYVSSRVSPLGSVFASLSASPQELSLGAAPMTGAGTPVLLFALLAGAGRALEAGRTHALKAGTLLVIDPARAAQIVLDSDFRALLVRLESASFLLRLLRTSDRDLSLIDGRGVGAVCMGVVQGIAAQLDQFAPHDLLPIEATLADVLLTCLPHTAAAPEEDTTSVQLAHLRRVCRTVEALLGDAGLSLEETSRIEGLSTRYVQKLFKVGGTSFGEYLRERRLERCRLDLANRALDHFTIAELCFRWGFGDAANFSRAFTARFGQSPRAYRSQPAPPEQAAHDQRGRPRHGSGFQAPGAPASAATHSPLQALLRDHARYAQALALIPKRAAPPASDAPPGEHYYLPVSDKTVHWGYLSRALAPVLYLKSGDVVTIETLTQHANDDRERMVDGDPGAESVFHWTATHKAVDRRGAGPMDASIFGRGAGEGFGVHICTGPVYVREAEPGDVLEVRILDIQPRRSCSPAHHGRVFGSNAAAWWGFHYRDQLTEPKAREVVTIYEIDADAPEPVAQAVYNFRWTPQTDPFGVVHPTIDYPGVPVDPAAVERRYGVLAKARVPVRPHFGLLAVAPKESGYIDSIPPGYFGGNLDNWRAGKGASLFLPVSVPGALFSAGDPHASQGDSELCGTAIECSLTGMFQLVVHKRADIAGSFLGELDYPFLETPGEWIVQGFSLANHLAELGQDAQAEIYKKSSLEGAMRDAFHKVRRYLMLAHGLDEDEAVSLISVAVDFGVTQVVDGNWGVHAIVRKSVFPAGL